MIRVRVIQKVTRSQLRFFALWDRACSQGAIHQSNWCMRDHLVPRCLYRYKLIINFSRLVINRIIWCIYHVLFLNNLLKLIIYFWDGTGVVRNVLVLLRAVGGDHLLLLSCSLLKRLRFKCLYGGIYLVFVIQALLLLLDAYILLRHFVSVIVQFEMARSRISVGVLYIFSGVLRVLHFFIFFTSKRRYDSLIDLWDIRHLVDLILELLCFGKRFLLTFLNCIFCF